MRLSDETRAARRSTVAISRPGPRFALLGQSFRGSSRWLSPRRVISTRKTATRTSRGPVASRYPRDATPGLQPTGPPPEAAPHEPWL